MHYNEWVSTRIFFAKTMAISAIKLNKQTFKGKAAGLSRRKRWPPQNRSDDECVIPPVLQTAAIAAVAVYLGRCRLAIDRRNRQSWDALLIKLTPEVNIRVSMEELRASPVRLWTLYQNAQAMQEFADYALRNSKTVDRALVESLHCDATRARFWALAALARYAFAKPAVQE
ncbi:MAG: hypothetical protein WBX18_06100 [Terracidiphilus sp.]